VLSKFYRTFYQLLFRYYFGLLLLFYSKEFFMKKNDIVEISIEDITLDGSGVGRYDGLAIFVPNAVTGDLLKVKILKISPCAY
jgi:hypothetical protein